MKYGCNRFFVFIIIASHIVSPDSNYIFVKRFNMDIENYMFIYLFFGVIVMFIYTPIALFGFEIPHYISEIVAVISVVALIDFLYIVFVWCDKQDV